MNHATTLEDRLDRDYAPAWRPEPGEKLVGTIVDIGEREGKFDDTYLVITVLDDSGQEWAWHAFHTVAKSELAKLRPSIGDRIGVKFLGKPAGREYHGWKVVLEPLNQPEPDWDRIAAEAKKEAEAADIPEAPVEDDIPF